MPERRRVVTGPGPLLALGRAEQDRGGIDLITTQRKPVSARRADDDLGAEAYPGPRNKNLQRLDRVLRLLAWPQCVHQPGGAAPRARVLGQKRKQALQPGAGDLHVAITHPRQQGQLNGHRHEISRSPPEDAGATNAPDALALYDELGAAEAEEIRARLAAAASTHIAD